LHIPPQAPPELRLVIEENRFALLCQPIRSLKTGGAYPIAEVLIRLREEEQALVPPGDFLPIFEQYKMMPVLDRWVVRNTIQQIADGSRIPAFSVNLAGQTLADADFPRFVAAALRSMAVQPASLLFEIDETDIRDRPDDCIRFAAHIRTIGCGVMLDSFGSTAASFGPLKVIRPDYIKVDGSVIREVLTVQTSENKLKAIVRIADALAIGVIGACIEEQDVLSRIKALGVGFAQGFGILRPHPIELARQRSAQVGASGLQGRDRTTDV